MKSLPEPIEANALTMSSLVDKCQRLCSRAETAIRKLPAESEQFLARNLEDALAHLDLILNALDQEGKSDGDKAQRFLQRLTRGLSGSPSKDGKKHKESKGAKDAKASHEKPDLRIPTQGLQGNSWTVSLPELLGFLAFGRKTGVLWVDSPEENFLLGLVDGELMHASSDRTPEGLRLGESLVGLGYLTRRQLERFLEDYEKDAGLSGEALLESGLISDDELRTVLVHQARQLFIRLIETKNAIFRFREGMEIAVAYQVSLNVPKLLLESARVQDELSKPGGIRGIVGDLETDEMTTPEDWHSWNQEMLSELATLVLDKPGGTSEHGAKAQKADGGSDDEPRDAA